MAFQGSLVEDPNEMKGMVEQGAIAFKLYLNKALVTFDSSDQTDLMNALQAAKQAEAIVTVHAEDGDRIRKSQQESLAPREDIYPRLSQSTCTRNRSICSPQDSRPRQQAGTATSYLPHHRSGSREPRPKGTERNMRSLRPPPTPKSNSLPKAEDSSDLCPPD